MYGGENDVIQGISQSVYQFFGIPASLAYGNNLHSNEFTIDAIFPDLFTQNKDDLKNSNGLTLTLDTTNLRQNYLIGSDQENEESVYQDDNLEEEANEYELN